MTVATMPLTELTTSTIRLLCREIGVVNTARLFISLRRAMATTRKNVTNWLGT